MVTQEHKSLVDLAFNRVIKIRQLKRRIYKSLEMLGEELHIIYSEFQINPGEASQLYGFDSFNALLEAPEDSGGIDFSKQTAYQLLRVFEKYVIELKSKAALQNMDYTKLDIIRKVVTPENLEEWLHKAQCLARSDLRREVNESLGKEVIEYIDKIKTNKCPKCGYEF